MARRELRQHSAAWRFGTVMAAVVAVPVYAGALDVSPVLIDIVGIRPGATSLTLRNRATTPANVQMRVFRWRQKDGADVLEPTQEVAVSPPLARVAPGAPYVIRVVRLNPQPVTGEESYRLLIDELPSPASVSGGTVQLAVRQVLPVFYRAPSASVGDVTWTLTQGRGQLLLSAVNHGDRRVRVANLRIVTPNGGVTGLGQGLAGYVLGHAGRTWQIEAPLTFRPNGARILFDDTSGPKQAIATPSS